MRVTPCFSTEQPGWLHLRESLWPQGTAAEHLEEMRQFLAQPERFVQFIAYAESGEPAGMVEASVRTDYVNGTDSSPVVFLEGIFVTLGHRRQGIARALVTAVADWGAARGCQEFASDASLHNEASHAFHRALGFAETERVVYFRRPLIGAKAH